MDETMKLAPWDKKHKKASSLSHLSPSVGEIAKAFHQSFPQYEETKLYSLSHLAEYLGVGSIFLKDESTRFGLNAFKGLGASFAMGKVLAQKLGLSIEDISYDLLLSPQTKKTLGTETFITATDGNHGRAVAWTASALGHEAIVYMPKGSAPERLRNIQKTGAKASITAFSYDDTVRLAKTTAETEGYTLLQDTAWEGYEEIPNDIMAGYLTMALEAAGQMGDAVPTHIFLQAGVGSFASAMTAFFRQYYSTTPPIIVIVEPTKADCFYRSALKNDDKAQFVTEDMDTIMAGLACGEPSTTAFPIIRDYADFSLSCPDYLSAKGMRILAAPLSGDTSIVSGESGALPLGTLAELMTNPFYKGMRNTLSLDETAKILCFSTEGDTDRENYRKIIWDGAFGKQD